MEKNIAETQKPKRRVSTNTIWTERIKRTKRSAIERDLVFDISADYIEKLFHEQGGKCAISGLPLEMDWGFLNPTASLDRRENHRGYVKGNVQWIHKTINYMKRHYDQDYFVAMCMQIAAHHGSGVPLTEAQRKLLAGQPMVSADCLTKPKALAKVSLKSRKPDDSCMSMGGLMI